MLHLHACHTNWAYPMGNCLFGGGLGPMDVTATGMENESSEVIRVVTTNGGVMEFSSPTTVEFITDEFPGHGIFRSLDLFWKPLPHYQVLEAGEYYHLLPLGSSPSITTSSSTIKHGHVRSNSSSTRSHAVEGAVVPYRMSFDSRQIFKRSHTRTIHDQRLSPRNNDGFWKVKLVISPQQLLQILSQEAPTEELIQSVRTVAKSRMKGDCPLLYPGHCSLSSSSSSSRRRNDAASSNKDALLLDIFQ